MKKNRRPGHLTEYAKHAGISKQAAAKQLQRVGVNYLEPFDFSNADRLRAAARHADRESLSAPIYHDDEPDDDALFVPADEKKDPRFVESQARREMFKAKLAELEFLDRVKAVIQKDKVTAEAFRIGRLVRDAMLNIPDRVAGVFAAETDQRKIHAILLTEIRQALSALVSSENLDNEAV